MRLHGGYDKEGKEQAFREKVLRNVHQQPQMIDSPPSVPSGVGVTSNFAASLCAASAAVNLSQGSPSNGNSGQVVSIAIGKTTEGLNS